MLGICLRLDQSVQINLMTKVILTYLFPFNSMDYGDYADTYFDLADKFENLFHRPVDLVTDKSLKNPYFVDSVNQTKTLLYG